MNVETHTTFDVSPGVDVTQVMLAHDNCIAIPEIDCNAMPMYIYMQWFMYGDGHTLLN